MREKPIQVSVAGTKSSGRLPRGLGSLSSQASESVIIRSGLPVFMARLAASRGMTPMPVASTSPSLSKALLAATMQSSARV
ncbi:MAG: hypothetical protein U5K56_07210 [Halioglobus sp.]|nr:hypothetical protein [Halioglobus sp.]